MAPASDMGLRRDPQPPMPMVIPSFSSATTSSSVIRLSTMAATIARAYDMTHTGTTASLGVGCSR